MISELAGIKQYLTFNIGEETFAFEISRIREVLDFTSITKVPKTPDFVRGVINLRGEVVPVVDMRVKFGMPQTEATVNTCIIIVEIARDGKTVVIGALADSVQEVFELELGQIGPPPRIGTELSTVIKEMGKRNDQFIMVLDVDMVFSDEGPRTSPLVEGRAISPPPLLGPQASL